MLCETLNIADIEIAITRKNIKNVHLTVHPPCGRVTLSAPTRTRLEVARAFVLSKLSWIRTQQTRGCSENKASEN
jgi:predicted metal-dependent hydrolase